MKRLFSIVALFLLSMPGLRAQDTGIRATDQLVPEKLVAGQTFRVIITLDLPAPWHTHANPASAPELIPTELKFDADPAIAIGSIEYPNGVTTKVNWSDTPVSLYTGRVIINATGRVLSGLPRPLTLHGTLRYQACDDKLCYAPKEIPVTIETQIVAGEGELSRSPSARTEPRPPNSLATLIQQSGLLSALLVVFLSGLALNLTPCVYPMITITVSYFGGTASRTRQQAFTGALIYCIGIVTSYTALGAIAALTGGILGALLQSKWILLGVAALLVVLALSLFGLFEIRPPQFLVQRAAGMSNKAGHLGVFFLGATMGIIAAPCLAPFAVALLAYVGATRQWWWFLVFSCGLALPYLVLGTFSGLLSHLPKSGTWMVWVKRIFGTAMLGAAVWFAWPVLGLKITPTSLIAWQPYAPQLIISPGQPVIIDFSADWCLPCREMDKETFHDTGVVEEAKQFRMLRADMTADGSPAVATVTKQFSIQGVPTVIFLDAQGREHTELRQVGLTSPREFLVLMQQAKLPATNAVSPEVSPAVVPGF